MRTLIKIVSLLKWIGLLGFPIFFSSWVGWKILWLFWLFAILEIILTLPIFVQSIAQLIAMFTVPLMHRPLPSPDNYQFKVSYSVPLKGKWLIVNGGTEKKHSHSWSIHSQRYAYDFLKIDEKMHTHKANHKALDNYYCYEEEITSPADGKVVKVVDKFKDSKIIDNQKTDPLAKNIPGNYIIIKHAEQEYSFLAHLKPNSIIVQPGDNVKRHQKIGLCGNSGNTTEPHLHFQIQTGISFNFSAGIPICFKDINIEAIPNYHLLDSRDIKMPNDNLKEKGQFINRGYIVENKRC